MAVEREDSDREQWKLSRVLDGGRPALEKAAGPYPHLSGTEMADTISKLQMVLLKQKHNYASSTAVLY